MGINGGNVLNRLLFILLLSNSLIANELSDITSLLKRTHQECSKFELLSDRLLCYRRIKKSHRSLIDTYLKKIDSEKKFPKEKINKLKKELYTQLEIVY